MKAMVLTGINQMKTADVPDPQIVNDTDVLLKLAVVGVCGSDVHYYETGRIGSQVVEYPYRVGHECAAVVEAVGPGVDRVKPGDRVAIEPAISCHQCDQCLAGRPHTCRTLKFLGCPGQIEGCLSERLVMPQECCFPIPDAMTFDQAALSEPLSIGYYAVQQSGLPLAGAGKSRLEAPRTTNQAGSLEGARVGILGSGPIGLSALVCARGGAERLYVTDKIDARLDAASGAGADWTGNPDKADIVAEIAKREPLLLDVVYECAGQPETIDQAMELLKPGGTLMLVGIPREDRVSFAIDLGRRKEIRLQNVRRQNHCVQPTLDMISEGRADVDFMVTHRYPFEQSKEAFDLVAGYRDGVVKAMIYYDV